MSKSDDEVPFLARWSRMKQKAVRPAVPAAQGEREAAADSVQQTAASTNIVAPTTDATPAKTAETEPPLDLEKLPRVDELTAESDIVGFLDSRVPAALRNAALSRMWTLDPTIRDFIEVAENQWNWNIPGGAPFYEMIEEGSTAGLSFADATSAISRTLTTPEEPATATEVSTGRAIEISDRQKSEPAEEIGTAAQHETPVSVPASVNRSDNPPLPTQEVGSAGPEPVATQQNSRVVRRRHGGALPA